MFNNVEDIKNFIKWCRQNKVKGFKINDISMEMSELAFIEELDDNPSIELLEKAQQIKEESKFEEAQQAEEDEDLLFWSAD